MAFHLSCTLFSVKVLCLTHYHGLLRWDIYSYRFYIVFWRREFEKNFCFAVCQVNCSNYSGDCLIPNTMRNAHEMHNIFAHEIQYGLCGKYPGCIRSRELLSAAQLNHNTMDINLWIGLHFHFQCEYQNIKENTFGRNPQCTRERAAVAIESIATNFTPFVVSFVLTFCLFINISEVTGAGVKQNTFYLSSIFTLYRRLLL